MDRIWPSFRSARKQRNEIKRAYRKNIQRIETDEPVETLAGVETYLAGDDIEKKHMEVETFIRNVGEEEQKFSGTRTIIRGSARDEIRYYSIPDKHEEAVKDQMREVIEAIQQRNRLSMAIQFVVIVVLLFFITLLLLQSPGVL